MVPSMVGGAEPLRRTRTLVSRRGRGAVMEREWWRAEVLFPAGWRRAPVAGGGAVPAGADGAWTLARKTSSSTASSSYTQCGGEWCCRRP
jgi:hypothetical protein